MSQANGRVLPDLSAKASEEIATLRALVEKLMAERNKPIVKGLAIRINDQPVRDPKTNTVKPGKRGLSVLHLNAQFPITLYANQWRRLAEIMPDILRTIDEDEASDHPRMTYAKGE